MTARAATRAYAAAVRRLICGLVVTTWALTACGGDDDDRSGGSSLPASTATTSSSPASGAATTTTGSSGSTQPPTTETTGDGDADGFAANGRVAAFITGVDGDARTVAFDQIDFVSDPEADNDYRIDNPETVTVVLPVARDASVRLVKLSDDADADLDAATFEELAGYDAVSAAPFWITVEALTIVSIEEQYVP